MHGKIAWSLSFQKPYGFWFNTSVFPKMFDDFYRKNMHFSYKMEKVFAFFSEHGFDGVSPTSVPPSTRWSLIFFFVRKLVTGASPSESPFFKMGLLLSYKNTPLRKRMLFLRGGEGDRTFYSFFSLTRMNFKKRASRWASPSDKLSNKKKIWLHLVLGGTDTRDEMTYFWPVLCSYLRPTLRYQAENFTTASSLQPQHMLKISARPDVPRLRSTFEGGGLNPWKMIKIFWFGFSRMV